MNRYKYKYQPSSVISTLFILLGTIMLGFVVTKGFFIFQEQYPALDTVEMKVEQPGFLEELPQLVLDLSAPLKMNQDPAQVLEEVNAYVETQYNGDNEEMEAFFTHVPTRISIPSVGIESQIEFASLQDVSVLGDTFEQWVAPLETVGWHFRSALPGEPGNTVLNGHHNIGSEVFRDLYKVQIGDEITLVTETGMFSYQVASVMILPERSESHDVRLQNARWIQQSDDERVTLITCWPYESNSHRVIVVALPIDEPAN